LAPNDTSPAAAAVQLRILREKSGAERLAIAFELSALARELTLTRLELQHPEWSESDRMRELLRYAFGSTPLPAPLR
jgi:hypothetical protein